MFYYLLTDEEGTDICEDLSPYLKTKLQILKIVFNPDLSNYEKRIDEYGTFYRLK